MIAKWNEKEYKLIDNICMKKSSREITYTDIIVDFTDCTISNLPFAQQEIKIFDNDILKFTGFVADYGLPELNELSEIDKELKISLFSPRQMATKRIVTVVKTDKLSIILEQILNPLCQDGFYIKEKNIDDKIITIALISRTVEEILNYLSKKYAIYWNIDENKGITINSTEYLFNKPTKKNINKANYKEELEGLINITPSVENLDYANIINVKNARIFYKSFAEYNVVLKKNDRVDFENPIDVSLSTARRIDANLIEQGSAVAVLNLRISYNNTSEAYVISGFNTSGEINEGLNYKDIGRDDSENKLFTLEMDSMFKNLATGITYKGDSNITLKNIYSNTALKYANMKLINWQEINKLEGKVTPTGQIEKVLDVKEGWFTVEELIDYIRSLFINNDKSTNQVNLYANNLNELEIGDKLTFDLEDFFVKGDFIVTAIDEKKVGNMSSQYNIELRNTNLSENYVNLFRSSADIEEQTSQTETEYIVEYIEDEKIQEIHEVEFANNQAEHTLNFNLKG